jgi:hypothetical protein
MQAGDASDAQGAVVPLPARFDVDPLILRVSSQRLSGADPGKLQLQIAQFGRSVVGMPRIFVVRGKNGELQVFDGVTRATRVAKLLPGHTVPVEVIMERPNTDLTRFPTIKETMT